MWSFLILGFVLGLRHALEADHLAAVATLSTGSHGRGASALRGVMWGGGHAFPLLAVGAVCLALGTTVRDTAWIDRGVGLMLIVLGGNVLLRLKRQRVH